MAPAIQGSTAPDSVQDADNEASTDATLTVLKKQEDIQTSCAINKVLLPIKLFYFFFYGACGAVIPFISVFVKSLHLTAVETGIVTGVSVLIPLFLRMTLGVAADKWSSRKNVLLFCCAGFGTAFFFLWFVPERATSLVVFKEVNRSSISTNYHGNRTIHSGPDSDATIWVCLNPNGTVRCTYPRNPKYVYFACQAVEGVHNSSRSETLYDQMSESSQSSHKTISSQVQHPLTSIPCFVVTPPNSGKNPDYNAENSKFFTDSNSLKASKTGDRHQCISECHPVDDSFFVVNASDGQDDMGHVGGQYRIYKLKSHVNTTMPRPLGTEADTFGHFENEKQRPLTADSTFVLCFLLVSIARAFYSSATSLADAVAYCKLGAYSNKWGRQRMWGTIGTAFSVMGATIINDSLKGNNFSALFFVCLALSLMSVLVGGLYLHADRSVKRKSIRKDVFKLLGTGAVRLFLVKLVAFGIMCGTAQNFFFWFLADLGTRQSVLGLCVVIHCTSSVFILRFSSRIFKHVLRINVLRFVLVVYVIRFTFFSFLTNAWLALPIELLHGITYSLLWATASSTASHMAPPGLQASCQGIAGAAYWDMGRGLGNLIAGQLIHIVGARWTFRAYALTGVILLPTFCLLDQIWPIIEKQPLPVNHEEDISTSVKKPSAIDTAQQVTLQNSSKVQLISTRLVNNNTSNMINTDITYFNEIKNDARKSKDDLKHSSNTAADLTAKEISNSEQMPSQKAEEESRDALHQDVAKVEFTEPFLPQKPES